MFFGFEKEREKINTVNEIYRNKSQNKKNFCFLQIYVIEIKIIIS